MLTVNKAMGGLSGLTDLSSYAPIVAVLTDPTTISGLALWLKADVGTFQDTARTTVASADGDPVGGWADQSGAAVHASQATAGKRPLLKTNILNGLPGILADGVDDALQTVSLGIATFTEFLVFKLTGTAGMVAEHGPNAGSSPGHFLYTTSNYTVYVSQTGASATATARNRAVNWGVDNAAKLVTHDFDGTNAGNTLRINRTGQTLATVIANDPGAGTRTAVLNLLGRNNGASFCCTGYLFEYLLYTPQLSVASRMRVENYLQNRWQTPA